ncbi:hypothetical protein EDD17DRAFT_709689 [Pisolithus thermaeus]|nr:hypothetical protein EDD17DRAFT_709689 [Pisolithus thermaeus]
MVALTSLLRNPVLPKAEIHSRLGRELHRLFFDSFGLGMFFCLYRSDSGSRPYLGERTLRRHSPGRSISSSSKPSKSDRVEEVKDKLLEMFSKLADTECSSSAVRSDELRGTQLTLRALALVYVREKHGCAQRTGQLAGWNSLQTRERRNPRPEYGGSQLSIRSRRLRSRICRCSSSLTGMYGKSTSTHCNHASFPSTASRPHPDSCIRVKAPRVRNSICPVAHRKETVLGQDQQVSQQHLSDRLGGWSG